MEMLLTMITTDPLISNNFIFRSLSPSQYVTLLVNVVASTAGCSDNDSQKLKVIGIVTYLNKAERYNPESVELDQCIGFLHGVEVDLYKYGFSFARLYHMILSMLSTRSSYSTGHPLFLNQKER